MGIKSCMTKIKELFFKGLVFLLPFTITFTLFSFFFRLIHHWLEPLRNFLIPFLEKVPHHEIFLYLHYEVFLVIGFIIATGFLLKSRALRPVAHYAEKMFANIPLIRAVYPGIKQLIHAFTSHDQDSFNTVVLVQFPVEGVYSVGFLTRAVPHKMLCKDNKRYINIYIPMTPNPTHGFFIMVPEGEYIETDLTRQEATSLIISGGILQPERYAKRKEC